VAAVTAAISLPLATASAQSASSEVWPEIDVYWTGRTERFRVFAFTSLTNREEAETQEGTIGVHLDYLAMHWGSIRSGYTVTNSLTSNAYREQRWLTEIVFPRPKSGFQIRNRARLEMRWIGGAPSQRLRDRLQAEREFLLPWKQSIRPYATYELYYDTRYHALSRHGYRFGAYIMLGSKTKLDLSFVRQDNRFGEPRHVSATAPVVAFFF
jgi:hypothetical protein